MSEMLTFREDEDIIEKLDELAKQKMRSRLEIVRGAVRDYVTRKLELVDILGYEDAKKVAYYKDIAEASFAQGLE